MAAKNLKEVFLKVGIKQLIREALMVGPVSKIDERIEVVAEKIESSLRNELKDFFAHAHGRRINTLRKNGQPFETADYQIREFLEYVFGRSE